MLHSTGVFTELEAAQYICANYGIQTCSGFVAGHHTLSETELVSLPS